MSESGRTEEAVIRWLRESGIGFACHHCRRLFFGKPRALLVLSGGDIYAACKQCAGFPPIPTPHGGH